MRDAINWNMRAAVLKLEADTVREIENDLLGGASLTAGAVADLYERGLIFPDRVDFAQGNALVTVGRQRISDLLTGTGATAFTNARGMVGVGNSSTATTAGMTALQGASQLYKALDGAPGSTSGVISGAATFIAGEATFSWQEWCMAIATATPVQNASFATATTSGVMLNRKAEDLGTKGASAVWTLSFQASIS